MSTPARPGMLEDRLVGLPTRVRRLAEACRQSLVDNDQAQAAVYLEEAMAESPQHPELWRLCGIIEQREGRIGNAIALFRRAARAWPDDGLVESNVGAALAEGGDIPGALRSLRRATELDPSLVDAWFNLGRASELVGDAAGAHAAFSAVLELAPGHETARVLRAEALKTLGRIDEAEAELRAMLRANPDAAGAWVALSNLKSFRASEDDRRGLERLYANPSLAPERRIDVGFAYASALEAEGDYARAFEVFGDVNAAKRRLLQWNAAAVSALVDDLLAAFAEGDAEAAPSGQGEGTIFLVGMPRSGSTLAEQIFAAHPAAVGAGETGLIAAILQRESARRAQRFPQWVATATAADWERLGREYLAAVAPVRSGRRFVDKTPTNWQTLGAIRRMLPAARIVHCVRDPLETAWSCYKHNFARDQVFSYDFDELAAFFRDEVRAMRTWCERYPGWIHEHRYEALIEDPERAVRALLAHAGLEFDPACLRFHEVEREVRTASAAQVRRPLDSGTAVAVRYGALLDPLRSRISTIS